MYVYNIYIQVAPQLTCDGITVNSTVKNKKMFYINITP